MKTLCMVVLSFVTLNLFSQTSLSNTKWKAVFLIPHAVDVILDFKKDTLYITAEGNQQIGTLTFSYQNDTLMITKISGSSPCPEQSKGWYRIEWLKKDENFLLHPISDECEGRAGVFTMNPYERVHSKQ